VTSSSLSSSSSADGGDPPQQEDIIQETKQELKILQELDELPTEEEKLEENDNGGL
jgi:hypothetical protein